MNGDYTGEDLVFLVGCPRSGTTWLQRLIASHPAVHTGQESHLFDFHVGPQLRRWESIAGAAADLRGGIGMGCYLTREEFRGAVRRYMLDLLRPMREQLRAGELFLEKTPEHGLFIREIVEMLPAARFISMVRDPRAVVASLLAASRSWGSTWAPSTSLRAARLWTAHAVAVREARAVVPAQRWLQVRFEDLYRDTAATLASACRFLGFQWDSEGIARAVALNSVDQLRQGHGTPIPVSGTFANDRNRVVEPEGFVRGAGPDAWADELSPRQRLIVRLVAGAEMEALGYGRPARGPERLLRRSAARGMELYRRAGA
jgi:hypothetical protein